MKRKHVVALLLAVTAVASVPTQAFAANEAQMVLLEKETATETTNASRPLEFTYDGPNYTGHCRVDAGKIIMNGITMKPNARDTVNFVFPSSIKHNGKNYGLRDVVGIHQEILTRAKTLTFDEGIENIVLYPSMLHLDELTLPSTLNTINGPRNETLPNGDFCIYLDGRVKKVNIPENSKFGYSKKYNCIYDKNITTTDPDAPVVDKSSLNEAIKAAEDAIVSNNYTNASISLLKDIVAEAKTVMLDKNATQSVVDEMTEKVNQGIKNLIVKPNVNKTALDKAIKTAEKELASDKYTDASISALKDALNEALEVLHKEDAEQDMIDSVTDKLNQAIKNLVEKVVIPMTPLEPAIPNKPEKPEIPLTPLEPAIPIKPEVNKSALEDAIKVAEEKAAMTDKYTADSIANLNSVLSDAKALLEKEEFGQADVDEMVERINNAVNSLVEKVVIPMTPLEPSKPIEPEKPEIPLTPLEPSTPVEKPEKPDVEVADKSELEDVIEKAEKEASLTKKYTKDSIANLNAIVKDAKIVLDKSDVTQEEIDAMVAKVNTAMKELVLVKPELKPDDDKKPVVNDEKPADKTTAPKTGDPASAGMIATLLAGSGATIAAALKKRK